MLQLWPRCRRSSRVGILKDARAAGLTRALSAETSAYGYSYTSGNALVDEVHSTLSGTKSGATAASHIDRHACLARGADYLTSPPGLAGGFTLPAAGGRDRRHHLPLHAGLRWRCRRCALRGCGEAPTRHQEYWCSSSHRASVPGGRSILVQKRDGIDILPTPDRSASEAANGVSRYLPAPFGASLATLPASAAAGASTALRLRRAPLRCVGHRREVAAPGSS